MSKFILGNAPITSISGPIKVSVLKPSSTSSPYVLLFSDSHFERTFPCYDCKQGCYELDDHEFLKLIDGVASKSYPIDFFTEQEHEVRIGEENIYEINPNLVGRDTTGYLSKFLHDYKVCYSKSHRRTKRYRQECPTRDIRWHFVDTRNITNTKYDDALIIRGYSEFYNILYKFFNKDDMFTVEDSYDECKKVVRKYHKELVMIYDLLLDGPGFVKKYFTPDSNFLLVKQIKKQATEEHRNIDFWVNIITDRIKAVFINYINSYPSFTIDQYIYIVEFYTAVIILIFDENISKAQFEITRFRLINSVKQFDLFSLTPINLYNMLSNTTMTSLMDCYTVARMLKKVDTQPFLSMLYLGDYHIQNIKEILIKFFGYTVLGESRPLSVRCQDVSNIDFNLVKVKQEYK